MLRCCFTLTNAILLQAAYLLSKCKNMAIHLEEVSPETVDNGNTVSRCANLLL